MIVNDWTRPDGNWDAESGNPVGQVGPGEPEWTGGERHVQRPGCALGGHERGDVGREQRASGGDQPRDEPMTAGGQT